MVDGRWSMAERLEGAKVARAFGYRLSAIGAVLSGILMGGCELEEVEIPTGEEVFIVHAIMRPDQQRQFVLVESSWRGEVDPADLDRFALPPNSPQLPVEGAVVTVSNVDFPSDPCGSAVVFNESAAGLYQGPGNCPTLRPGDRLELEILVPNGEAIRGTTEVVGLDSAWVRGALDTLPLGSLDSLLFNRDIDTLQFAVYSSHGRLVELQFNRLDYFGNLSTSGFDRSSFLADTNDFVLPGTALDILDRGEGEEVLRAGRRYLMTVAMTDANYFDFVRSQNNELTGRGFINHLEGAVGVFGSLVALPLIVDAIGEADDPREGTYRMAGTIQGIDVDATLSIYQRHQADSVEVSGFLRGAWVTLGEVAEGAEAFLPWDPRGLSHDGTYVGSALNIALEQPFLAGGNVRVTFLVSGFWAPDSFQVTIADDGVLFGARDIGTLWAVKQ